MDGGLATERADDVAQEGWCSRVCVRERRDEVRREHGDAQEGCGSEDAQSSISAKPACVVLKLVSLTVSLTPEA